MESLDRIKPVLKRSGIYGLFLVLLLALFANGAHKELSFKGSGYQVYPHITTARKHGESNELKLWFRTKQLSGMLVMIENGRDSLTLVGMYKGKLR